MFIAQFDNDNDLIWATRFGASSPNNHNTITDITSDGDDIFVTGQTFSDEAGTADGIPVNGAFSFVGNSDAFLAKFDNARALVWSSYYGGSSDDWASAIQCNSAHEVFLVGSTQSEDLPTLDLPNPAQNSLFLTGETDVFISKFSNAGSFIWARYFGGAGEESTGILNGSSLVIPDCPGGAATMDEENNLIFTGKIGSGLTPIWPGPIAEIPFSLSGANDNDAFVAILNTNLQITHFTYWGGIENLPEIGCGVATFNGGSPLVLVGETDSKTNLPTKKETIDSYYSATGFGKQDGFVSKIPYNSIVLHAVESEKLGLTFYPNPTSEMIWINPNNHSIQNIEIYDVLGKRIRQIATSGKNDNSIEIFVGDLPPSVYFISCKIDGKQLETHFIKN
jgi:Secretion system C-terminal sorting domain